MQTIEGLRSELVPLLQKFGRNIRVVVSDVADAEGHLTPTQVVMDENARFYVSEKVGDDDDPVIPPGASELIVTDRAFRPTFLNRAADQLRAMGHLQAAELLEKICAIVETT